MFKRIEPVDVFIRRMVTWSTEEICEEIRSNNMSIFFSLWDLREIDDLSSPKAIKLLSWIHEINKDNELMMAELQSKVDVEFCSYLHETLSQIFNKKGGSA